MEISDKIIAYEQGDLTNDETIELFQELVNSGLAWQMGGYYGRRAECLIKQGKINARRKTNEEAEYENHHDHALQGQNALAACPKN